MCMHAAHLDFQIHPLPRAMKFSELFPLSFAAELLN